MSVSEFVRKAEALYQKFSGESVTAELVFKGDRCHLWIKADDATRIVTIGYTPEEALDLVKKHIHKQIFERGKWAAEVDATMLFNG